MLIAHKSGQLFKIAIDELKKQPEMNFDDNLIFIVDNIINQLNTNKSLLTFISKNLSWGIFKNALTSSDKMCIRDSYKYTVHKSILFYC